MKIREFWQHRRLKRALSNIRKQTLFFGVDLSHLSDEEIERRLVEAAKRMAGAGMPASVFARGLQRFAQSAQAVRQAMVCPRKG